MSSTTIEWATDVWNPVTGCRKVSAGCANCYAADVARRFWPTQYPGVPFAGSEKGGPVLRPREFEDVRTHPDRLDAPLRWRKPRRVFVNSMSDLFHEDAPDEFIDRVFAVMALATKHTFLVLTKRPARMKDYCRSLGKHASRDRVSQASREFAAFGDGFLWKLLPGGWALPNVHLGVSVEDQRAADERIPLLLDTPAAVRWISAEPLLGPVNLHPLRDHWSEGEKRLLDWVVVGGESGPRARPCDVAWIRSVIEQCRAARVPAFCKQLGRVVIDRNDAGFEEQRPGSWPEVTETSDGDCYQGAPVRVFLRDPKGGDPDEWPADLRVRELPT